MLTLSPTLGALRTRKAPASQLSQLFFSVDIARHLRLRGLKRMVVLDTSWHGGRHHVEVRTELTSVTVSSRVSLKSLPREQREAHSPLLLSPRQPTGTAPPKFTLGSKCWAFLQSIGVGLLRGVGASSPAGRIGRAITQQR